MEKTLFSKPFVIGIIILFVGASVIPTISGNIEKLDDISLKTTEPQTLVDLNWTEDFESYENGTVMHNVDRWEGWDGVEDAAGIISTNYSRSGTKSLRTSGIIDAVAKFEGQGYTSGVWNLTLWIYMPSEYTGSYYFIMLGKYTLAYKNWATQVSFDSVTGLVKSEPDGAELELITGQWVEIRNIINLDADYQAFYYGGDLLFNKSWTDGVSGGGPLAIGAIDLWSNGASDVYHDDFSLIGFTTGLVAFELNITGGLGVTAKVKNVGDKDATNVDWEIDLEGGLIIFGRNKSGRTVRVKPGVEEEYKLIPIGIGRVNITFNVVSEQAVSGSKKASALVLLFLVLQVKEI